MLVSISTKTFKTRFSGSGECIANSLYTNATLLCQLPNKINPTLCCPLMLIWKNYSLLSSGGSFLTALFKTDSEFKPPNFDTE